MYLDVAFNETAVRTWGINHLIMSTSYAFVSK